MEILLEMKLANLHVECVKTQSEIEELKRERDIVVQAIARNEAVLKRLQGAITSLTQLQQEMKEAKPA